MSDDGSLAREIPQGKGQRLILLDAVDKSGFLNDCTMLFKSHSTDGRDYHTEMNSTIFEKWVKDQLIPAAPENSCVVYDNAPYHSRRIPETVAPTSATRKPEMKKWLQERNIPFSNDALKPELYEIIKRNKEEPKYVVDEMIKESGHEVLRLPPYHCDLNPIEMVWGIIKNDIGRKNTNFKIEEMKQLTKQAIADVPPETFHKTSKKTQNLEENYWKKDGLTFAPIIEPQIAFLDESSSSASESEISDTAL